MEPAKNEQGYALVFMTLMIILLLIMVGMGLDTGHLSYIRSQGQPAVDAAALAAASAIPSGNWSKVTDRAAKFNPGGTNPGTGNNYLNSPQNQISQKNVTLVKIPPVFGSSSKSARFSVPEKSAMGRFAVATTESGVRAIPRTVPLPTMAPSPVLMLA